MEIQTNVIHLKNLAKAEGIALFGVADVMPVQKQFLLPEHIARRFSFGISLGFRLSSSVLDTLVDAPNQIYYFHYQRVNMLLDHAALKITAWIQEQGGNALPIPASQIVDWERQLGAVSHREIAMRAGLGWYGKNNLLVNERYGSQVRYATVLTDMPLTCGSPAGENSCGGCEACITSCPARAIQKDGFDRNKCHAKLKEFCRLQRIGQMICGVCLKVCPGNSRI